MKATTKRGAAISSLLFFLLPSFALAQVQITEILYDAPGSDSGREWVEVANTGSETVDIGKYKLFENGTNHGLVLVSGSSVLAPGQAAVIASDAKKFSADWPAYSGALFDSAFSLSNTGETLAIKNASSSPLDTASYASAADADGTGGSLNLKNSSFVAAMASPGLYPGPMTAVPKAPAKAVAAKKTAGKASVASSSAKKASAVAAKNPASVFASGDTNAAGVAAAPLLPPFALWMLGLAAVMLLGIAGIFFLMQKGNATPLSAEEFKIE